MAGTVANRRAERRTSLVQGSVLVIDDEADIRELLELSLLRMGLAVQCSGSVVAAKQLLQSKRYDLCLTDMRLPDGDGLELVRFIGVQCADLPVAVITAFGSTENAVAALKAGAFDYLTKPLSLDQLRTLVKSAMSLPQKPATAKSGEPQLLGSSPGIEQVRSKIEKLARSQAPIYLTGESGSGKELAARLIHAKGSRRERAFVPVNCGAIPENLMEREFFGYKKGAFTGAEGDRDGFFQAANTGTLFLDEVADLPLPMQVKLLRAIQDRTVRKVGATQEDPVDVRIISATHQKLGECVEAGKFRHDLYYRLNVIELRMPALREMREDIPQFVVSLLDKLARNAGAKKPEVAPEALEELKRYDFPGNVRELENVLERAMALCSDSKITAEDLQLTPEDLPGQAIAVGGDSKAPLQDYLDRVEKEAILEALEKTRYNRTAAAKLLGITFRSMRYRMERLGLN